VIDNIHNETSSIAYRHAMCDYVQRKALEPSQHKLRRLSLNRLTNEIVQQSGQNPRTQQTQRHASADKIVRYLFIDSLS